MKHFYIALSILFIASTSFSQESTYQGLVSKGEIPDEFTKYTLQKIEDAKSINKARLDNVNKKEQQKFLEMTNFGVDELLQSGQVCFNDTISSYVSKVLNKIRESNPDIPENIRVYTIKSTLVNAYTSDQGIIFINTGLLAQLENEAQLAFILCHEMIHYIEDHVREQYEEDVQIVKRKDEYRNIRNVDKELASSKYSRELETEADKLGLELFLNTEYNPQEIDGVFDVLLYSFLPFDEIEMDFRFLEIGDYIFPQDYYKDEIDPIEVDDNEDDTGNSHPNIKKRRKKIENLLGENNTVGKDYLVSVKEFFTVRSAARYEVLRLQLINGRYSEALYSAFLLENEYPDNSLAKIAIGEILFAAAVFENSGDSYEDDGYYYNKQGNIQQAYYFMDVIDPEAMTLLAVRYNYYLSKKFPDNKSVQDRLVVLFRDLTYYYDNGIEDINFSLHIVDTTIVETESPASEEVTKASSKYDRIKSNKNDANNMSETDWAKEYLFAGCECEEDIEALFEKGEEKSKKKQYYLAETGDPLLDEKSIAEQKSYSKKKQKHGRSLGIDKIVMVDPFYAVFKQSRKKNPYKISKSKEQEYEQLSEFEYIAEAADLDLEILSNYKFSSADVDKFNDFSLMNEWVNERLMMEDKSGVISSSEEVNPLIEKYGTKYFAWTGVLNIKQPRSNRFLVTLFSFYSVVGIPYGIYYLASSQKDTYLYFVMFNIETGELVMIENREVPMKDTDGILQSQYYDMFNQIKKN